MVLSLFLASFAWGFSSGPVRSCLGDADCALVRETHCGVFSAVAIGQDQAWADFEAKARAKDVAEGRVCPAGPRPNMRDYEAVCLAKVCEARVRVGSSR